MSTISNMLATGLLLAGSWTSSGAYAVQDLPGGPAVRQLNLHPPVTRIAQEQHSLHWMMLVICTLIFVAVFAVMFYSIWKHRKSRGAQAAHFHESVVVELAWTIVPFLIIILMALPATKVLVAQKDTTNADLTVKVTGYQWKWGYDYLRGEGEGLAYISTLDSNTVPCPTAATWQTRPPTICSRWTTRWWCRWTKRCASSPRPTT